MRARRPGARLLAARSGFPSLGEVVHDIRAEPHRNADGPGRASGLTEWCVLQLTPGDPPVQLQQTAVRFGWIRGNDGLPAVCRGYGNVQGLVEITQRCIRAFVYLVVENRESDVAFGADLLTQRDQAAGEFADARSCRFVGLWPGKGLKGRSWRVADPVFKGG